MTNERVAHPAAHNSPRGAHRFGRAVLAFALSIAFAGCAAFTPSPTATTRGVVLDTRAAAAWPSLLGLESARKPARRVYAIGYPPLDPWGAGYWRERFDPWWGAWGVWWYAAPYGAFGRWYAPWPYAIDYAVYHHHHHHHDHRYAGTAFDRGRPVSGRHGRTGR